jgi:hypothetical protein
MMAQPLLLLLLLPPLLLTQGKHQDCVVSDTPSA